MRPLVSSYVSLSSSVASGVNAFSFVAKPAKRDNVFGSKNEAAIPSALLCFLALDKTSFTLTARAAPTAWRDLSLSFLSKKSPRSPSIGIRVKTRLKARTSSGSLAKTGELTIKMRHRNKTRIEKPFFQIIKSGSFNVRNKKTLIPEGQYNVFIYYFKEITGGASSLLLSIRIIRRTQINAQRNAVQLEGLPQTIAQVAHIGLGKILRSRDKESKGRRPAFDLSHIPHLQGTPSHQRRRILTQSTFQPTV